MIPENARPQSELEEGLRFETLLADLVEKERRTVCDLEAPNLVRSWPNGTCRRAGEPASSRSSSARS